MDKRGSDDTVEGWVRVIKVTVTTPPAEDFANAKRADMTVEFRGPKHFRKILNNIGPRAKTISTFRAFPVGEYELIVKWGDETITKTVKLIDDPTEIELVFQ